jgi:hypothetical protein
MNPDQEQAQQEKEYESVSEQSDQILLYMQDRFQELMSENRMDDAIAIGDEYIEWIGQYPDEVFLYFNENELKQDYEARKA